MKVIFFQTPEDIAAEWPHLLALFQRLPSTPEYELDDLRVRALDGRMHLGCLRGDDGRILIAGAFEFIYYPRLLVLNIVALAGEGLDAAHDAFFDGFRRFAQQAGAGAIEARVGDGMARLLAGYGFSKAFNQVRVGV